MRHYTDKDVERRYPEPLKQSQYDNPDGRGAFNRDRARVLHSAALRRLADKTQVVGPRDGDTPRTRLTHSLEVAQIARGIGSGIGVDPDLAELAALSHDIGHPPYGHNGEVALNTLADQCGGFEGNAQTLRILSRLEPKIISDEGESFGLNLTRAALRAASKYPWPKVGSDGVERTKYGAYGEDQHILDWILDGSSMPAVVSMEAQVMDASDDIAYSVHDVEDGILSGRVSLSVLWDLVELAALAEKGQRAFGGSADLLVEAAGRLRQLPVVAAAADYDGGGGLVVPAEAAAEVQLLKTIAVLYVMDNPLHQKRQDRQRDRIYRVYDYLTLGAPGSLDPMFSDWYISADTDAQRQRVIIDQIASMTESRLERLARDCGDLLLG